MAKGVKALDAQDRRALRSLHHLILMRSRDRDPHGIVHPGRRDADVVVVQPEAPALGAFLDAAAERFGHDLMAETDADQFGPALERAV